MKTIIIAAIAGATLLAGCTEKPEVTLSHAVNKCEFIGFDIDRERVPTLECRERQYDRRVDARQALVNTGINTVAVAATGVAIQNAMASASQDTVTKVEHSWK